MPRCSWGFLSISRSHATGTCSDREDAGESALVLALQRRTARDAAGIRHAGRRRCEYDLLGLGLQFDVGVHPAGDRGVCRAGPEMTGPGNEIAPAVGDYGHLRASHADREQVISILKAAFAHGLMGKDEFDLRVGRALTPRTRAELAALIADLPAGLTVAQPPKAAQAQKKVSDPFTRTVSVATLLYAGVWAYVIFLSPRGGDNPSTPPLIIGGLSVWLLVFIFAAAAERVPTYADPPGDTPDHVS